MKWNAVVPILLLIIVIVIVIIIVSQFSRVADLIDMQVSSVGLIWNCSDWRFSIQKLFTQASSQ